jgi:ribosomal-protein-alanine N-acetyltransferase
VTEPSPLTTPSLLLRPVVAGDADAVWRLHSDLATNAYNPAGPMTELDQARRRTEEWVRDWARDGIGYWAVEQRSEPGHVVGFGGIRRVRWRDRDVVNLYYRLAPTAWGKGLAGEIVAEAVARWRQLETDLPLIAYTTADNVPSQRTATKGGLVRRPELDEVRDGYVDVVFGLGLELE